MILTLLLACAHPVDITLTAADIAPTTANGAAWDGPNALDPGARGILDSAMATLDPSGQLAGAIGGAAEQLARPDPAGSVTFIAGDGAPPVVAQVPEMSDTFAPTWAPGAGTLRSVQWSGKASLDITLVDKDLSSDDPIGKVRVSGAQLAQAEAGHGPMTMMVADQTSGQLRSVSILVARSAPAAK